MNLRSLIPMVAVAAWAQQPSPEAATQTEAALRGRAEQFYQLQVEKKFRQAEAFVAEDSKDLFYNQSKPDLKSSSVVAAELLDDGHARVTTQERFTISGAFGPQELQMQITSSWKLENGVWVCYVDTKAAAQTPFGKLDLSQEPGAAGQPPTIAVDPNKAFDKITLDNASVTLDGSNQTATVTISNGLPGPIHLELLNPRPEGVLVDIQRRDLKSGEKTAVSFRATGQTGKSGVVRINASPVNKIFEINVRSN